MNNEEKFKENLQNLVNSKEFPFDESHWESARNFIDLKRTEQRNRWLYFSFAALLVIGTSFTAIKLSQGGTKEIAVTAPNIEQSQSTSAKKSNSNNPVSVSANQGLKNNPRPEASPAAGNVKSKLPVNVIARDEIRTESQAVVTIKKSNIKNEPASIDKTGQASSMVTASSDLSSGGEKKHNEHVIATLAVTKKPSETESQDPAQTKNGTTAIETTPEEPVVVVSAVEPTTQQPAVKVQDEPVAPPAVVIEKAGLATTPSVAVNNESQVESSIPLIPEEPKEVLWSVEGGISYMFGWKGVESPDAKGFNPVFGIHYYDYLTKKLSVSFGGQYNRVNNLSNSSVTSKVTKYSLGENSNVTVITPERLHYITIPLRVHYDLDSKNNIGFGYSISYLLNVDAKVEKYTINMGKRSDESSYTTAGYTEGFRLFDSQLSLFYKRVLYKNLRLKAEVFYGLNDIKNNEFFNADVFERNKGIKLMLVYDIFRK